MGKNILVTGGMGFIGSNFIINVLDKHPEHQIINLDALTYAGNPYNLQPVSKKSNYTFVKGDIQNRRIVDRLLSQGIDTIVNFAAETHVDRSIDDASPFVETNIRGVHVLLEAAKEHGIEKFVQVSTDEVYGSLGASGAFREDSPLKPNSPYSASKASADMLVRAYHNTYGVPAVITRCSNNFGPRQFPEKLIPKIIFNALNDRQIPIYGDGKNVRDWLYVSDHCEAVRLIMEHGKPGEIYNIGGNNELTNIALARRILNVLGKSEKLLEFVPDRPGHDRRYAIDNGKINRELVWTPRHTFEEGLQLTLDWYTRNVHWLRQISSGEYRRVNPDIVRGAAT